MGTVLDREEYIEQAYLFRVLRERLGENLATQEVLSNVHEEILSTTRLPYAIQFLATELKHTGCLSSGFARLPHYFTAFQAFVMQQTEDERRRFSMETALAVLEREAQYRAAQVTPGGLFVYQFETLSRNRLGYDQGLTSIEADPFYDGHWRTFLQMVHRQVGVVDFGDMIYVRSQLYVQDQRRLDPAYEPPLLPLFGEKEGKIARANRGRDPLYLFAALQRQLAYPEVPHARPKDDLTSKFEALQARLKQLEMRMKLIEGEVKGHVDLSQLAKPGILKQPEEEDV